MLSEVRIGVGRRPRRNPSKGGPKQVAIEIECGDDLLMSSWGPTRLMEEVEKVLMEKLKETDKGIIFTGGNTYRRVNIKLG